MTDDASWGDDPGWVPALKGLLFSLVPGTAFVRTRRQASRGGSTLMMLRSLLVTFVGAILLIGGVVAILATSADLGSTVSGGLAAAVTAVFAVASVVIGEAVGKVRRLDCSGPGELAKSYGQRFFLRIGVSEAAALLGFVGFLLTGKPAVYAIGAVATGIGFYRLAPTSANIIAESDRLQFEGCPHRLEQVLLRPPTAGR